MAHRLRESREEKSRRGRGRGSCGSHFIKPPGNRQGCSFRSVCQESEPTEKSHVFKYNHKLHHHYNVIENQIQMVALRLLYFTIWTDSKFSLPSPLLLSSFLILHHSLCLYDKLALCSTTTCFWHYRAFYRYVCVYVCVRQFTHPLGPGLCPCVKRQSLFGGFCCEENRRCNMKCMFHCNRSDTFLRCTLRFIRWCFVADTSVGDCVCLCVLFCVSVCDLENLHSFLVRLNKWLQMTTNIWMLRPPCCSKSCGA